MIKWPEIREADGQLEWFHALFKASITGKSQKEDFGLDELVF